MSDPSPPHAPSVMRAALREAAFSRLGMMVGIMDDENARDADRIRAWSEVATFGLGRADHNSVHLHAEANLTLGIVQLPALERSAPPDATQGVELADSRPRSETRLAAPRSEP